MNSAALPPAPARPPAAASAPSSSAASSPSSSSSGIRHAAEQFEALFVGQLLHSVRESSADDSDEDGTNSTFLELAEEQMAQALTARGGLGMATMVMKELGKTQ
jgi:flagellar protein FlgJ